MTTQTLDITITIPPDYVLVKKVDWEEMIDQQLTGKQWKMSHLCEATERSPDWLKEHVLYPNKEELDVEKGGFVKYPEGKGSYWRFSAIKMTKWLEENLERVM